ncbi:MAG: UxaA family hydrolase [Caldilineaceae bacterium]|nr:UxaA family hydrolase [Caldilineaceae bacterium]
MSASYHFDEVGRLPLPGDNVAIATRRLEAGTTIEYLGQTLTLDHTVMEGHRFAVQPLAPGEELLSWELPFGVAIQPIEPGNYVVNDSVLHALHGRALDFTLPAAPNFKDRVKPYVVDAATFQPAPATPRYATDRTFLGYPRGLGRGVGTRNTIVLLGTTSRTGSYVKQLATRLQSELKDHPNIDGIVPIAHTEGGVAPEGALPNNLDLLLRTLAGFMVNPNVGAVLVVDYGIEPVTNKMLEAYLAENNYPIADVLHTFLSLSGGFQDNLAKGEAMVRAWLPTVNGYTRTPSSVANLRLGLQCGGSDAFSGISANPLLGWISHELIRYGGAANLAETDELIGAEPYVLQKVRDLATAQKFLQLMEEFRARAAWHGADAEGNPSGGNKYRGLYNITLKSIGAARKKDPATRLDYAIDYGSLMREAGYYFMDSPGNDLESIAGQIAAGCNLIFFTTGNGSITNFPYVPTIKVVTTSRRFQLLANDMDVNAGLYQEGLSMDELGNQTFDLMVQIASGQHSVGEKAGHSQVQIWRNWRQSDSSQLQTLLHPTVPTGTPIAIPTDVAPNPIRFTVNQHDAEHATDQIGLILPTSLCAGQVANLIAQRLNKKGLGQPAQISRVVALVHTEGCGNSAGLMEQMYARTMVGYITHPLVKHCLLLEHGCEKTHNDFMRHQIEEFGGDPSRLGFASIQLDGGIDKVTQKVEAWFTNQLAAAAPTSQANVGLEALRVGLLSDGPLTPDVAQQLAILTQMIVGAGGMVVVPENTGLLSTPAYRERLLTQPTVLPSLAYGEHARQNGFHIMETPTEHWVETVTGLAATGVELILALVNDHPQQTHPLVPVIQIASAPAMQQQYGDDLDLFLGDDPTSWIDQILERSKQVVEHTYAPRLYQQGNIDFQFTRGLLGVSL